jgi:predicted small secreted protein
MFLRKKYLIFAAIVIAGCNIGGGNGNDGE